jgi:16S rRNA (cytidine1402-2'-O)-methyltransferase
MKGSLYLIPNTLGGDNPGEVIPEGVVGKLQELDHFIVENERNARRFLIKCGYQKPIDSVRFFLLNKHTSTAEKREYVKLCTEGQDMGVISEAGLPGVADPGAEIVGLAHHSGIRIVPLTGPSSILLALMSSGMNGQEFCFHGYLPVKPHERKSRIRELEIATKKTGATQIFIETPYRNNALLQALMESCNDTTRLCIACDLTLPGEYIKSQKISSWKKERVDLHKRPCIFLIN